MKLVKNAEIYRDKPQRFAVVDGLAYGHWLTLPGGEVQLSGETVKYVLKQEKCDLTADEIEIVRLERELERARMDGICRWELASPSHANPNFTIRLLHEHELFWAEQLPTEAEALAAAAAHVEEMRNVVAVEPEEMDFKQIVSELEDLGWTVQTWDFSLMWKHEEFGMAQGADEKLIEYMRRVLRQARAAQ